MSEMGAQLLRTDYHRLQVEELEPPEQQALLHQCAEDGLGYQLHNIFDYLNAGTMAAYRWTGNFNGLTLIRVHTHPGGNELFVWHLSGRGFLEHIVEVRNLLKRMAREHDCKWVSAEARSMYLAKQYAKLSKMTTVSFRMEV